MTDLTQLCLDANSFSGPLPILSGLNNLVLFSVRRNQLMGTVPLSSVNFPKLTTVSLADNLFQGPTPESNKSKVHKDIDYGSNSFCLGSIPIELTTLPSLERLDVSDNQLDGIVPNFRLNVIVYIRGNPGLKISLPPLNPPFTLPVPDSRGDNSDFIKIMSFIVVAVCGVCAHGLGVYLYTTKPKCSTLVHSTKSMEIHDPPGGNTAKITLSIDEVEFGNMIIPIQVLRFATNNFSEENILGRGGFGTVHRGMLQDGTKIAVKRMESRTFTGQCLASFKSEIEVLTKVRHRHLLTLLGYSQSRIERLLVYEYLPQGTLSRHLFKWEKEGLKPLEWHRRLIIALDVARGVEYLHGLANQSFIHRDLKPYNILLGDDMRAKVADLGLVRHSPQNLKCSIETSSWNFRGDIDLNTSSTPKSSSFITESLSPLVTGDVADGGLERLRKGWAMNFWLGRLWVGWAAKLRFKKWVWSAVELPVMGKAAPWKPAKLIATC
ncbi:hypothetical protein Pint_22480 [Pistacia integerrima]|uniref:Uncharacterized protein n=1 Tax=Pistacia integerrima TaxID=434235 RepID=A0ACC0YK63_9ROSI|nr:hypothetical protein Pint_22480 [Pistacia integerrima]